MGSGVGEGGRMGLDSCHLVMVVVVVFDMSIVFRLFSLLIFLDIFLFFFFGHSTSTTAEPASGEQSPKWPGSFNRTLVSLSDS